jgi:hypothetical protein
MIYDKNYLCYPTKVMRITQGYYGTVSHLSHTQGTPKDYPIDEAGDYDDRSGIYCPCDEMEVVKIYKSGATDYTNCVWYRSTSPVVTPTFTDYVVLMVVHMNDDTIDSLKVGQTFRRQERIGLEGKDGADEYHYHISIARGQTVGWTLSSTNCQVQTGDTKKPEECFFIDYSFSKMVNSQMIDFMPLDRYIAEHKPVEPPIIVPIPSTPSEPQIIPVEPSLPVEPQSPKEEPIVEEDKQNETEQPIKEVDKQNKTIFDYIMDFINLLIKILKGDIK